MSDLLEAFSPHDGEDLDLRILYLGEEPAMVIPFTTKAEVVQLHYVKDDEVKSYVLCPGGGMCPICYLGSPARTHHLLPVYNVESMAVEIMRVSTKMGPGCLGPALRRHLADPDIAEKVLLISRHNNRFSVEARPLSEGADRGERAVAAFLKALEAGLRLATTQLDLPPEELAAVPGIQNRLNAMGGFTLKADEPAPHGDDSANSDA